MKIIIDGPQLAEAIQAAAWVVEAPEIAEIVDRLNAVLKCADCHMTVLLEACQALRSGLERP